MCLFAGIIQNVPKGLQADGEVVQKGARFTETKKRFVDKRTGQKVTGKEKILLKKERMRLVIDVFIVLFYFILYIISPSL